MEPRYGKYRAEVIGRDDPAIQGRVLVASAVLGDGRVWASACVPPGWAVLPEVGDAVWIEFEEGDISRPLWTGCAWPASAPTSPVDPGSLTDEGGPA
jgi:hypothetical protein